MLSLDNPSGGRSMKHKIILALTATFACSLSYAQIDSGASSPTPEQLSVKQPPANAGEADRIASFASFRMEPHFLVAFDRPLQERAIEGLLRRASAQPYRAYLYIDGMAGTHSVRASEASLSLLDDARREVLAMTRAARDTIQNDVSSVLEPNERVDRQAMGRYARGALQRQAQNEAMLRTFETGRPVTYAVAVKAPTASLAVLRGSPNVAKVEVGYAISSDRAILPVPELPEGRSTGLGADPNSQLSDDEVLNLVRSRGRTR